MSGGGTQTQQVKNALPAWAVPYAKQLLGQAANLYMPGGQPGGMPANLNQQVAGLTPDQQAAMSMIQQRAGVQPLSNVPSTATLPPGIAAPPPGVAPPTASQIPTAMNTAAPTVNPPVNVAPPPAPPPAPAPTPAPKKKKKG